MSKTPSTARSKDAATPSGAAPAAVAEARLASLQPILTMARPVTAFLPIDSSPDAFERELHRQAAPRC